MLTFPVLSAALNSREMFRSHMAHVPLSWDTQESIQSWFIQSQKKKQKPDLHFNLKKSLKKKCGFIICLFGIESNASLFSCARLCQDVTDEENEMKLSPKVSAKQFAEMILIRKTFIHQNFLLKLVN